MKMRAKDWTETAAGWVEEPVCTRPYDVGAYGTGLYGRCKIMASSVWKADAPCVVGVPAKARKWVTANG